MKIESLFNFKIERKMSSIIKDPKWKESKDFKEINKNKANSTKIKYGSIKKPIYYTEKGDDNIDLKELNTLETRFDGQWNYMTLRYLIWRYPNLVFWTALKKNCRYLGSSEGHIYDSKNKKLLDEFEGPDGYLIVDLGDHEFYCVHELIMEMTLPDDMKAIYD